MSKEWNKSVRWKCTECGDIFIDSQILKGTNPFDKELECHGCPVCFSLDAFNKCCDEPGCKQVATCGTPVKNGYRQTCGEHFPKDVP